MIIIFIMMMVVMMMIDYCYGDTYEIYIYIFITYIYI